MIRILADNNAEGHLQILVRIFGKTPWCEVWDELGATVVTFEEIGIDRDASDTEIWRICQREQILLITNNRNADDADSLEAVIRKENHALAIPVVTLARADQLRTDRAYAQRTAESLLEFLTYLEEILGAGRIYIP
jgi:hypothetical protein